MAGYCEWPHTASCSKRSLLDIVANQEGPHDSKSAHSPAELITLQAHKYRTRYESRKTARSDYPQRANSPYISASLSSTGACRRVFLHSALCSFRFSLCIPNLSLVMTNISESNRPRRRLYSGVARTGASREGAFELYWLVLAVGVPAVARRS